METIITPGLTSNMDAHINSNSATSPPISDDITKTLCPICFEALVPNKEYKNETEKINKTVITLDCRHQFHQECILDWFKERAKHKKGKKSISKKIRTCPYCRHSSDYLELTPNTFPIKYIHKEYHELETYIDLNDFTNLKLLTKKYINDNLCHNILKSGASKGQQCKKKKKKDHCYCHFHINSNPL